MTEALQALADPNRRQIVQLLLVHDQPVGELVRELPIAQSGVSRHLRILREAGLVEVRKDGQRRVYSLRAAPLRELSHWLDQYRHLWESRLDRLEAEIARRQAATEPKEGP